MPLLRGGLLCGWVPTHLLHRLPAPSWTGPEDMARCTYIELEDTPAARSALVMAGIQDLPENEYD